MASLSVGELAELLGDRKSALLIERPACRLPDVTGQSGRGPRLIPENRLPDGWPPFHFSGIASCGSLYL